MPAKGRSGTPIELSQLQHPLRWRVLQLCSRQLDRRLRASTGAIAFGFGRRQRRGQVQPEWCLKVYVRRKVTRPPRSRVIPPELVLRVSIHGKRRRVRVPIDVVALSIRPRAQQGPWSAVYNEGSPQLPGTLTAVVRSEQYGDLLLAAGHVAARNTILSAPCAGERIMMGDGACIGALFFAPDLSVSPLDVALISPFDNLDAIPARILPRPHGPVTSVRPHQSLGAAHNERFELLSFLDTRMMIFAGCIPQLTIPGYAVGNVEFRNVLHFQCASRGGDSGALVVDSGNRGVGMHVLGTGMGEAFALPLDTILGGTWCGYNLSIQG